MEDDSTLEGGEGESDVLDEKSIESDGSSVDVSKSHRESVKEEEDGVPRASSGGEKRKKGRSVSSVFIARADARNGDSLLLLDVDSIGSHEGELQLDGLKSERLEVDWSSSDGWLGFGNSSWDLDEHAEEGNEKEVRDLRSREEQRR